MKRTCKQCLEAITSPKWYKAIFCSRKCFFKHRTGTHVNDEELVKMSQRTKRLWSNPEYRQKMSDSHKGKIPWNKGKITPLDVIEKLRKSHLGVRLSEETKRKMSIARKGKNAGARNGQWNGGSSFFPYAITWTGTLKESVRQRDGYICRVCGTTKPGDRSFHVHHIDYNKQNCTLINLITLCHRCHMKTNSRRTYWKEYFANLIKKSQVMI